jgi:hypothetical protein
MFNIFEYPISNFTLSIFLKIKEFVFLGLVYVGIQRNVLETNLNRAHFNSSVPSLEMSDTTSLFS